MVVLSGPRIDITGQVFGKLTAIEPAEVRSQKVYWRCQCECGNFKNVNVASLRSGNTKTCGCSHKRGNPKHGLAGTPEYVVWKGIVNRCTNESHMGYPNYGGRGVTICDRWRDFANFIADMGPRPSNRHTVDRIDVDGNYEPANCRWITQKEQCQNKTNNRYLTYQGRTMTLAQWCDETGMSYSTLVSRINRGWSDNDVISKPLRKWPSQVAHS